MATGVDDLLDAAPCGFVSFADDGTITVVNATLLDMLGYERGELTGRHVETILTLASRIFYQTHLFPMVKLHGRAEEIFLALRTKSGDAVGVLANAGRRERGGVVANDCVFMHARERRKYEDELLRARKAAEQARAAVELRERELERVNEQLETQALELELQHQQLESQTTELEATTAAVQATNEQLMARTAELERQRARADDANQAKSAFLATMSHELRTPLNAIGGYTDLLELGLYGPVTEAQHEAFGRIQRSQRHLLRLINDVLNLARIEAGRVEYVMTDVALAELIDGVIPMVEPQLRAKALGYEVRVPRDAVVRADREKLQQILLNLLTNAVKFTQPGGRLLIDTARRAGVPGQLFLRITDTGAGIPDDKIERVFEPFVQVDASHTRQHEGTGLGLAISRDLARGMAGDLRVRSVEGRGSTFTIALNEAFDPASDPTPDAVPDLVPDLVPDPPSDPAAGGR